MTSHSCALSDGIFNVEDSLHRAALARRIAERAGQIESNADECRIIGVFGGWGTGKTHLLRLVGNEIATDPVAADQHLVALFPAWRFELEGDLGVALLDAMGHVGTYPQLAELAPAESEGVGRQIASVAADCLDFVASGVGGAGSVEPLSVGPFAWPAASLARMGAGRLRGLASHRAQGHRTYVDELATRFGDVVDSALTGRSGRLIVLVDDLDRCSPQSMVRMLEWMKVYLRCGRCTFLVGLDHRAAARAIEGRYRDYLGDSSSRRGDITFGFRYLEKIFDVEFEIGQSPALIPLAARRCFPVPAGSAPYPDFANAARALSGRDFPWSQHLDGLLRLPCVGAARTVLRAGQAYQMALVEYCRQRTALAKPADSISAPRPLPRETPFWLLFLVCMQHTMRPTDVDAFVHGQGPIHESARSGQLAPALSALEAEHPARQFAEFLVNSPGHGVGGLNLPTPEQLQTLAALVRQKVADSLVKGGS